MKIFTLITALFLFSSISFAQQNELISQQDNTASVYDGYYRFVYEGQERGLHIDAVNHKFEEFDRGNKVGEGDIDFTNGVVKPNGVFEGSIISMTLNFIVQSTSEKSVVIEIQSNEGPITVELEKI